MLGGGYAEWEQILGTSQFTLAGTSAQNRAEVSWLALKGDLEFEQWCNRDARTPSRTAAREYLAYLNR